MVIFKQMADVILKGGTPYLDLNDNKGVLLYALYAVGQSIPNSKVGVFLICAVLFYISVFYWSKISQLLLPQSNQRWMVLWIGICFYTILQKLGGLTEDICLPICSYALYIGIRMVYTNQRSSSSCSSPSPTRPTTYAGCDMRGPNTRRGVLPCNRRDGQRDSDGRQEPGVQLRLYFFHLGSASQKRYCAL